MPASGAFRLLGIAAPVSYTHLDVYKRQAVAAAIAVSGTLIYLIRARRLGQWPFALSK